MVADSYRRAARGLHIGPDGRLGDRHVWADLGEDPDGICLDAAGAVWYADVGNRHWSGASPRGERSSDR